MNFKSRILESLKYSWAFGLNVRTQVNQLKTTLLACVNGVLEIVGTEVVKLIHLEPLHVSLAGMLVGKYGSTRRVRTHEMLQFAIARHLQQEKLLVVFVVANRLLAELAGFEGLTTLNLVNLP